VNRFAESNFLREKEFHRYPGSLILFYFAAVQNTDFFISGNKLL